MSSKWSKEFPELPGLYWTQTISQKDPDLVEIKHAEVEGRLWLTFRRLSLPEFTIPRHLDGIRLSEMHWSKELRYYFIENPNREWTEAVIPQSASWRQKAVIREPGRLSDDTTLREIHTCTLQEVTSKYVLLVTTAKPLIASLTGTDQEWIALFDSKEALTEGTRGIEALGMHISANRITDGVAFAEAVEENQWRIMHNPVIIQEGQREFDEIIIHSTDSKGKA